MPLNRLRVRTEGLGCDVESLLEFLLQLILIHFSYSAQLLSFKGSGHIKKKHIFSLSHANNLKKCSDICCCELKWELIYRPRHRVEPV